MLAGEGLNKRRAQRLLSSNTCSMRDATLTVLAVLAVTEQGSGFVQLPHKSAHRPHLQSKCELTSRRSPRMLAA
jgi:hypothetical protein